MDIEVFKYDWVVCYLNTDTRKLNYIANDKDALMKLYHKYKNEIWVGYNIRGYDQYIFKSILTGFNPYDVSQFIIEEGRKGWEYSRMFNKFPMIIYDTMIFTRSLKELEAYMGEDIQETQVPFNLDRKLTKEELQQTIKYCSHDVWQTLNVFVESKSEFESHLGLIKEFELNPMYINKTKVQLSAIILGARQGKPRDDEFDISFPDTLKLGKYEWIKDWYENWGKNVKDYEQMNLETDIAGVPHKFGIGGLHGAIDKYMGDGHYILADVSSYYPALMIEYNLLSRNVSNPEKYKQIRDERLKLKALRDPREYPRKIVLNGTYGAMKDKYNGLYDPLMANNVCVYGQLLLVDLIDKLEGVVDIIQSNTDGVLFKLRSLEDKELALQICKGWSLRTRMDLGFEFYTKVIQKDVNNFVMVEDNGGIKRKGSYTKELSKLDNDLPIVNKALVDYFIDNVPVEYTIMKSNNLIDFQKVTKVSWKYEFAVYKDKVLTERVHRTFATIGDGGILYKRHKETGSLEKTAGTPENCVIINRNIQNDPVPDFIDRNWYIELAKKRIEDFIS